VKEIVRFRGTNAGPFKKFDLNLKKRGLIRMVGKNGAGKSTLWHLLTQTGYGVNPNKSKKGDLSYEADETEGQKDFLIEVTFNTNGSTYVAAQAVKSKSKNPLKKTYNTGTYLFRDDLDISAHKDTDTQRLIKETLGWTLEEWYGYVYLAQKSTHVLIEGTPAERQTYLSALFNLKPLDNILAYCQEKSISLGEQSEGLEGKRTELNTKFTLIAGRNEENLLNQVMQIDENVQELNGELKTLQEEHAKFVRRDEVKKELMTFEETEDTGVVEAQLQAKRAEQALYESNQKLIQNIQGKRQALQPVVGAVIPEDYEVVLAGSDINSDQVQAELARLQRLQSQLGTEPATPALPDDLDSVLASPDIQYTQTLKKIEQIQSRHPAPGQARITQEALQLQIQKSQELLSDIAVLKAEIKPLEFNAPSCDKCGSTLDCTDREAKLAEKQEELQVLQKLSENCRFKKAQLESIDWEWREYDKLGPDLSGELPELKDSVEKYEKKIQYKKIKESQVALEKWQETNSQVSGIPELQKSFAAYQKKQDYRKLNEQAEKFKRYTETKETLDKELTEIVLGEPQSSEIKRLEDLLGLIQKRERLEETLISLKGAVDQTVAIQTLQQSLGTLQEQRGSLLREVEEVKTLSNNIQELQTEITEKEELYDKKKLYEILAKGYGRAGQVRKKLISKFSKYLEDALMPHTFRQLPQHRFRFNVDEGVDFECSKNGGNWYDVKTTSGGEKGSLSVACMFALDDLQPPSRRTNLKIVDEVEANFDPDKQRDFVTYTLPELRKRTDTVVVISHTQASQTGKYDAIWEIRNGEVIEQAPEERSFEEFETEEQFEEVESE
jgi:DNA repair exonuclease SbcCD ATPase subunit